MRSRYENRFMTLEFADESERVGIESGQAAALQLSDCIEAHIG